MMSKAPVGSDVEGFCRKKAPLVVKVRNHHGVALRNGLDRESGRGDTLPCR